MSVLEQWLLPCWAAMSCQYRTHFTVDIDTFVPVSSSIFIRSLAVVLGLICTYRTKVHSSLVDRAVWAGLTPQRTWPVAPDPRIVPLVGVLRLGPHIGKGVLSPLLPLRPLGHPVAHYPAHLSPSRAPAPHDTHQDSITSLITFPISVTPFGSFPRRYYLCSCEMSVHCLCFLWSFIDEMYSLPELASRLSAYFIKMLLRCPRDSYF
jgi:hypothetical protein